MKTDNIIKYSTATIYILLYVIVATISCICSIDFFNLTHNETSSIVLAMSFEIGSMGCLFGALTSLKKNGTLIWILFVFLTLMQMMNNTYYAYSHIHNYNDWIELFDLIDFEPITQKRIISIISGCILPLVSLSFIHLLVDLFKTPKSNNEIIKDDFISKKIEDIQNGVIDIDDNSPRVFNAVPIENNESKIKQAQDSIKNAINKLENYNKSK